MKRLVDWTAVLALGQGAIHGPLHIRGAHNFFSCLLRWQSLLTVQQSLTGNIKSCLEITDGCNAITYLWLALT